MSESESIESRVASENAPDDIVPRLDRPQPEREGLPRNYRMRADAHYVEQLGSPAQPVIRVLATSHIECRDLPSADRVDELTKSIAAHGVLQPLIVRRQGARYALITGRKRLAAAMAANLGAVPCLVHDADGPRAAAIAVADNLRVDCGGSLGDAAPDIFRAQLQALSSDLATVQTSLSLLRTPRQGALTQQVGIDLIQAQSARAAWLVASLLGQFEDDRVAPLGAIVHGVSESFNAHRKLMGLDLDCTVSAGAGAWKLPEAATTSVLTGAVFAMLASLEDAPRPRIELMAETPNPRTLKIEVSQRLARVSGLAHISEQSPGGRSEELILAVALRLAKAIVAARGGTAELTPLPGLGNALRLTFQTAQAPA